MSPNPDPKQFDILACYTHGPFIVLTVRYPNAINFEGKKILVFRNAKTPEELLAKTNGEMDPHFCQDGTGPIARFEPTDEGARLARLLVESASQEKSK